MECIRKERQTLQWNHNSLYIYVGNYFSDVRHQTAQSTVKKGLVSTVLGFSGGKIYIYKYKILFCKY